MQRRKIKLFASIASLLLVTAVMAFGVYAAASQSVNVSTKVSFNATGVAGTITGTLTGLDSKTYYYNSTNASGGDAITFNPDSTALGDWTLGDSTSLTIDNSSGSASSIVYTFTITNSSTSAAMVVAINDLTVGTNLEVTSVTQDSTAVTGSSGDYSLTNIAASGSSTVVVTLDVTDDAEDVTDQAISFTIDLSRAAAT